MMSYLLLFILNGPAYLGDYKDLASCQSAIREIYTVKVNPPGQRLKELEQTIDLQVKNNKEFLCVRKAKIDN